MNRVLAIVCIGAFALVSGCAKPPPRDTVAEGRSEANRILARADDRGQMSSLLGVHADKCIEITATTQLCEWRLGSREASWAALATAVGTRDRVNVLCELPLDGSPREPGSCGVYPRRSNRTLYAVPRTNSSTREREERARRRAEYRKQANALLASARTAVELSGLVGAAPEDCVTRGEELLVCRWNASNQTYGHGTLVESIGAEKRQRMTLECRLPRSGAPRGEGSCQVAVAG